MKYDREANAAYVPLTSEPVAKTIKINDLVLIDIDIKDNPVGIEILECSFK